MTDYFDRDLAALDEIEDVLTAYADARFSPSGPVLARMRAQVLREAAAFAATKAAERRLAAAATSRPSRWATPHVPMLRRAVALGMAAALTLGTGAAVLAAPPGSPFYNARIAIETAFLPSDLDARLASHEEHLTQRLAEAEAAVARGDTVALAAALAAYEAEVDAAVADLGDDPERLAHLEEVLGKHVAVLTALEARLPEQANIENAIERSQKTIAKIKEKGSHGVGKPSDTPGGGPGGQGNSGGQ